MYKKLEDDKELTLAIKAFVQEAQQITFFLDVIPLMSILFKTGFVGFKVPKLEKLSNIENFKDSFEKFISLTNPMLEVFMNNHKEIDGTIEIALIDFMKPEISKDDINQMFAEENLAFLIERIEDDKEFCLEILEEKYKTTPSEKLTTLINFLNNKI